MLDFVPKHHEGDKTCISSACYLKCFATFDAIHYVRRPIMEAKRTLENTRPHSMGCKNIVLDSMSTFQRLLPKQSQKCFIKFIRERIVVGT